MSFSSASPVASAGVATRITTSGSMGRVCHGPLSWLGRGESGVPFDRRILSLSKGRERKGGSSGGTAEAPVTRNRVTVTELVEVHTKDARPDESLRAGRADSWALRQAQGAGWCPRWRPPPLAK
ncbi:hypothetical protein PLANTIT3_20072 [Plantibacter sp. T3]|nr:hypothetical protein PLANTIT3_20072 [Plantibacter sp. T3]